MAVCHPLKAMSLFYSNQQAFVTLLVVVTLSLVYNLVRFWEFVLIITDNGQVELKMLLRANILYYRFYYTGVYLITHFLVPFVILTILNCLIAGEINSAKSRRKSLSRQEMREYKTAHMMIVIIAIFLLTNTIPYVMNIIEALQPDLMRDENNFIPFVVMDISNLLVVLNSSTTCFIYFCFSSKFRLVLIEYGGNLLKLIINCFAQKNEAVMERPRSFSENSQYSLQCAMDKQSYSTIRAKKTGRMTEISQLLRIN